MIDDYISIGKITSTFGLKGFLKVSSSGDVLASLKPDSFVYLSEKEKFKPHRLISIRRDKNVYIVSLEGYDSIDSAESIVGRLLYFPKKETSNLLGHDEYFAHQLIGLHPYNQEKIYTEYQLKEILENPVHPILLFSSESSEVLVPYINRFVGKVDLENNKIEILNWEEWLLAD